MVFLLQFTCEAEFTGVLWIMTNSTFQDEVHIWKTTRNKSFEQASQEETVSFGTRRQKVEKYEMHSDVTDSQAQTHTVCWLSLWCAPAACRWEMLSPQSNGPAAGAGLTQ